MNNRNFIFPDHGTRIGVVDGLVDPWKEKCRRYFPHEFRRLTSVKRGWSELHMELLQSSELNLSAEARHLFHAVRSSDAESITDEDIQQIYRSLFVRDGLGYELIELCDQGVRDRLYAAVISQAESDYARLNLMILLNKAEEADGFLGSYIDHFSPENDDSGESREFMKNMLVNGSTKPLPFDLPILSANGDVDAYGLFDGSLIETPLQLAAKYGRWEVARVLLNHGADVMGDSFHQALSKAPVPADIAVKLGHEEITRDLLTISSDSLKAILRGLLTQAVLNGDWRMSQVMLESGLLNFNTNDFIRVSRRAFSDCHAVCNTDRSVKKVSLSESLAALQERALNSDLPVRDKLLIATKALSMVKMITHTDYPVTLKQAAISEFYISTAELLPKQSDLSKLMMNVVSAAMGLVLGVVVGATLGATLGLGLVGMFAAGALCGAGAAFFNQKVLVKKDPVEDVCRTANLVISP